MIRVIKIMWLLVKSFKKLHLIHICFERLIMLEITIGLSFNFKNNTLNLCLSNFYYSTLLILSDDKSFLLISKFSVLICSISLWIF